MNYYCEAFLITLICFLFLLIGCFKYVQCGKEAAFYTKVTGIEVTRVDAFWLDLDTSKHVVKNEYEK